MDFAIRFFGVALHVAGLVRAVRVDVGNERDGIAIGRPQFIIGAGGEGSERVRFAARSVETDPGNLAGAVSGAEKRDLAAVGRPARAFASGRPIGAERTAVNSNQPNCFRHAVGGDVGRGHRIGHPFAVRRYLRIAQPMHGQQIIDGHSVLGWLRLGLSGRRGEDSPAERTSTAAAATKITTTLQAIDVLHARRARDSIVALLISKASVKLFRAADGPGISVRVGDDRVAPSVRFFLCGLQDRSAEIACAPFESIGIDIE
jgi:hypothetical protein